MERAPFKAPGQDKDLGLERKLSCPKAQPLSLAVSLQRRSFPRTAGSMGGTGPCPHQLKRLTSSGSVSCVPASVRAAGLQLPSFPATLMSTVGAAPGGQAASASPLMVAEIDGTLDFAILAGRTRVAQAWLRRRAMLTFPPPTPLASSGAHSSGSGHSSQGEVPAVPMEAIRPSLKMECCEPHVQKVKR